jgi:hypothetical protein
MKKTILITLVSLLSLATFAQSEKYTAAIKKNISMIDSAFAHPDQFLDLANSFERIGMAEKNQWLAYYYAAYCRVNYGFMQKDRSGADPIADKATELINQADSLKPNNSEVSVIKSMIATLKMTVNPQQRYMQYGAIINKELQKAIEQDATNPRPHLVKGQNLKFTPTQFGGGCKTAKPELDAAIEKFATFKPATEIDPNWGKDYAALLTKDCQ